MSTVVGIDLGTSNSAVAYMNRGKIEVIPLDGYNTMPSVVALRNKEIIVGKQAKSRILLDPANCISSSKRDIGRNVTYRLGREQFTPEDVTCLLLANIKTKAEKYLNDDIKEAVVTVPAYFTSEQREIVKRAAERAGLTVLRIMPEPTAAAIDYGIGENRNQTIMVYDLGGGTFDISILRVQGNNFEILAVDGDSQLGGDDFDNVIAQIIYEQVRDEIGIQLDGDRKNNAPYIPAKTKIKESAENAKKGLSEYPEVEVYIPNLINDYSLSRVISREEFEYRSRRLVARTIEKMSDALASINYTENDIDRIILVGGSTKMPMIRNAIIKRVKDPYVASNVDEVVARGAAFMAATLASPEERGKTGVNLVSKFEVKEKTVFTYGVDMIDDNNEPVFTPIVKKGSRLPAQNGIIGTTARPYQESVYLRVCRGESKMPHKNEYIGELSLNITNPKPDLVPVLALFDIDENMIIRFRSVEIPLMPEYLKMVDDNDIAGLISHVEMGRLRASEILIYAGK